VVLQQTYSIAHQIHILAERLSAELAAHVHQTLLLWLLAVQFIAR
jgi:hypothetical protein